MTHEERLAELARETRRSEQDVIERAVAVLHAIIIGTDGDDLARQLVELWEQRLLLGDPDGGEPRGFFGA